jgi:GNAT superfamily N-acetyltransferase
LTATLEIREIRRDEYEALGQLMINVYSTLDGFPSPDEQPGYYEMLANIGSFNEEKDTKVLVALTAEGKLIGGVVYFEDMARYGSGGTATSEENASGFRLLGVDPNSRGAGAGRALSDACIQLARDSGHSQVILHTTQAMRVAWRLYEKLGFERSPDLDFSQEELPVFGFRLLLEPHDGNR